MAEQFVLIGVDGSLHNQPMPEQDPVLGSIGRVADDIYAGALATADVIQAGANRAVNTVRRHPRAAGLLLTTTLTLGVGLQTAPTTQDAISNVSTELTATASETLSKTETAADDGVLDTSIFEKRSEGKRSTKGYIIGGSILAGTGLLAGTAYWAFNKLSHWGPKLPKIPALITPEKPPVINAAVHQETVQITERYKVLCNTALSGAVGIKGDNDGGTLHLDAHIDELSTVDVQLCGTFEVPLTITKDNKNGVTRIDGIMPTLVPHFPNINEGSDANCADVQHDATKAELDAAIAKYVAANANGKKMDCKLGAWQDAPWYQVLALESKYVDDVLAFGHTAAEIAAVLDMGNDEQIRPSQADIEADFRQYVKGMDGVTPQTVINLTSANLDDDQKMALRVKSVNDLLKDFLPVNPETDITTDKNGVKTLRLTGKGGQVIFLTLTGNWTLTDNNVFIPKLEEDSVVTKIINADGTVTEVPAAQANPTGSTTTILEPATTTP